MYRISLSFQSNLLTDLHHEFLADWYLKQPVSIPRKRVRLSHTWDKTHLDWDVVKQQLLVIQTLCGREWKETAHGSRDDSRGLSDPVLIILIELLLVKSVVRVFQPITDWRIRKLMKSCDPVDSIDSLAVHDFTLIILSASVEGLVNSV